MGREVRIIENGGVNIVGAGLAGISAAITLAKLGVNSNLVSLQPSERAQSIMAEGGINAALDNMGEQDDPSFHFADTMKGGCDLASPDAVRGLTEAAPEIVTWLYHLGVPFNMDGNKILQRKFGGQKKMRTAFAKSSSGKAIMTALIDEVRKYENLGLVKRYPSHFFLEPDISDIDVEEDKAKGEVEAKGEGETKGEGEAKKYMRGFWTVNDYSGEIYYFSGPTIIASGGLNGMFLGLTTGTVSNTGDVTASLFDNGVELSNLEFIQFHPTTARISGKRMLISEAARGEGGRLFVYRANLDGKEEPYYFMEDLFPELGNLMPRDVVSREMVKQDSQVYLDMRGVSDDVWTSRLSDLKEEIIHYLGVDPAKEPVPVEPGIHYFMGGIRVNKKHETNVRGLFAAGECACQYHGANRLGANSMLGAIYGGRIAANAAAEFLNLVRGEEGQSNDAEDGSEDISKKGSAKVEMNSIGRANKVPENFGKYLSPRFVKELTNILDKGLGIIRDEETLVQYSGALDCLAEAEANKKLNIREKRQAALAKAIFDSALARKESRGAHTRTDYPDRNDDEYKRTTVARITEQKNIKIGFEDIPE